MYRKPLCAGLTLLCLMAAAPAALAETGIFSVEELQVVNDRDVPEVCFTLNEVLSRSRHVHFEDFLAVEPATEVAVTAHERNLCLAGFDFGQSYRITLRAGLPSEAETALPRSESFQVYVPDRPASLAFRESGYVLPRRQARGIPLHSVNVARAKIALYRINDRNLIRQLQADMMGRGLSAWDLTDIEEFEGEKVWSGELEISGEPNRPVTTVVPVGHMLESPAPGLYVTTAADPDAETPDWWTRASQWFVLSDLGLTSYQSEEGLWVSVRSLETAAPQSGVRLSLLAHNNASLGEAVSDDQGLAHFPAGLVRGRGGNRPHSLLAYGATPDAAGDFTFLDLTRPGLDLLDRGVAGRALPGALDAFLYSERGIYRPGERVQLAGLLRDGTAAAVADLPLTLIAWRPDGQEFRREVLNDKLGGYAFELDLPETARSGPWTVTAHVDPEGPAIGRLDFTVADFVPPQIETEVSSADAALEFMAEAEPAGIDVAIAARYLYGAPAGNLTGEASLQLRKAEEPFADYPGYSFGLVQEEFLPSLAPPQPFQTDAAGEARFALFPEARPDSSHPLEAEVTTAVFDLSGRAVHRALTLPVRHQAFAIGLRPRFEGGAVAEGGTAAFDIVTLGPDGAPIARQGLEYVLFAEDHDFVWYQSGGQWYAETVIHERRVTGGSFATDAAGPAEVAAAVEWGRYRLEVFDPMSGIASSSRFSAGWWVDPNAADRPDDVEVTLDRESYKPGETARVFIKPPFAGEVSLVVADRGLRQQQSLSVPAEGASVELTVGRDWTAGAYILATAFTPAGGAESFLPRRAVGTAWLAIDPGDHRLAVKLAHPDRVRPNREVPVALQIDGLAEGEAAFVTLAAVDDGVLQLTEFTAPDPEAYFLGQRLLGVTLRDLYGQLIDPRGDVIGRLRSGGDLRAKRQLGALPERSSKIVALFSGIRPVGPDGRVEVALELPDFNGRLRLMAVAWSKERFGAAEATMTVRDPLVARVTLPRFLAPGDEAEILAAVQNLDGPDGRYSLILETEGPIQVQPIGWVPGRLEPGGERRRGFRLSASGVGVGTLRLTLSGPDGLELVRERKLSVRPANPVTTKRLAASLPAGGNLVVGSDAFTGLRPETVSASLSVSALPRFDIPGLLASLDRYPYGCVEQTTSRALPLLYVNELAAATGGKSEAVLRNRVQKAIYRLATYQQSSGGFGLWGLGSSSDLWLSAYALDFLTRAAESGYHVPTAGQRGGLAWLKQRLGDNLNKPGYLAGAAYAHYVLARSGAGSLSEARYFFETRWNALPSDLARAQVAAALSWYGDAARAQSGFAALTRAGFAPDRERADYGTPLRDLAAAVALMAESRQFDHAAMRPLVERLAASFERLERPSTQEMVWLVLAAHGFAADSAPLRLSVDGEELPEQTAPFYRRLSLEGDDPLVRLRNRGERALYQVLTLSGVAEQPLPAKQAGFHLTRGFFNLDGTPLDLDQVRQNDSFVMTVVGESLTRQNHRALVVHLLPAGWEIEEIRLGQGVKLEAFPWLGELSRAEQVEYRDDRFVAAFDLTPRQPDFSTAFILRAVTPGSFVLPGGFVEDMYRPSLFARQAQGRITVLAPGG